MTQTIIGPKEGWKEETFYLVKVKFNQQNPTHKALFYSGFLTNNFPGNYNSIYNPSYEANFPISEVSFLKVLKELDFKLE